MIPGCKYGDACRYLHDPPVAQQLLGGETSHGLGTDREVPPQLAATAPHGNRIDVQSAEPTIMASTTSAVVNRRAVHRPIPKIQQDRPREFELSQVIRRFAPNVVEASDGSTTLSFGLRPSDPDFPFELDVLECLLEVPAAYPEAKPRLRVTNKEMGRGYQINIERGFDAIVERMPNGTLLQYCNNLDRALENLLSTPPADTIKFVGKVPSKSREPDVPAEQLQNASQSAAAPPTKQTADPSADSNELSKSHQPTYSAEQIAEARGKRDVDLRQLEARLGRMPLFTKLPDGSSYIVPVEPRKRTELPLGLQSIKTIKLVVPPKYNLEPCRIEVPDRSGNDVEDLIEGFTQRAKKNAQLSVVSHLNFLSQNMHTLVAEGLAIRKKAATLTTVETLRSEANTHTYGESSKQELQTATSSSTGESQARHIITIPRPPEWSTPRHDNGSDDEESDSEASYDTNEDSDNEEKGEDLPAGEGSSRIEAQSAPERGVLLSFPHLEMHGIELLELVSASLTVKCNRCKQEADVNKLRNSIGESSAVRRLPCSKCSSMMQCGMSPSYA